MKGFFSFGKRLRYVLAGILLLTGFSTSLVFSNSVTASLPQAPPPPYDLAQVDPYGDLPVGELLGSPSITFRFQVVGSSGQTLTPEVELRPISESFSVPNLVGNSFPATGSPQEARVVSVQPLGYHGFHWRARVRNETGASSWVVFGARTTEENSPTDVAGADFYNLYEPLAFDERPPIGFDALARVGRLPLLASGVETRQVSSFDRSEGNLDGGSTTPGLESFFYREGDSAVLLEVSGPGQINRIWFAELNDPGFAQTRLQFFFDGATEVSYEIKVVDMMSGQFPPFVRPFVLDADRSSGGWISYTPIPFHDGVKVRIIGAYSYYQITYQVFSDATGIETFSGDEDYHLAQYLWQRLGQDPKPTRGNALMTASGTLAPSASVVLADLNGPGVLQSLKLQLPQVQPSIIGSPPLEDSLRMHKNGASQFVMTPTQNSVPTRLRLRRNCLLTPQAANVYVNGTFAGAWVRSEGDARYRWCDDAFLFPGSLIVAGAPMALRIASTQPENAWTEARYWLEQEISGAWTVVDMLDVGDAASEQAHTYTIQGQTASVVGAYTYPPVVQSQPGSEALLNGLRLRIWADGTTAPVVDAPVGAFFGSGVGETNLTSLLAGILPDSDTFYSYWPMPYGARVRVELYNGSTQLLRSFQAEIAYVNRAYPFPGELTGYFRTMESLSRPTQTGLDHPLLGVTGVGHLVGFHLLVHTRDEGLLEGDERFHVDGMLTPGVRGTGTEDCFNSGWYYNRGRSINALHGANSTRSEGWIDQYRWYLSDYIPFSSDLTGGIEHGPINDANADYSTWSLLYLAPRSASLQIDTLDFGDPGSVSTHHVQFSGPVTPYNLTAMFEGDNDNMVAGAGYRLYYGASVNLTLSVNPDAQQIVLRRRYDQGEGNQRLRLWVNGEWAGEWLDGGRNSARRWRESTFLLAPRLTQGRNQLVIRIEPGIWAGSVNLNMSQLSALSLHHLRHTWLPIQMIAR
jgi:hypothetical protein